MINFVIPEWNVVVFDLWHAVLLSPVLWFAAKLADAPPSTGAESDLVQRLGGRRPANFAENQSTLARE